MRKIISYFILSTFIVLTSCDKDASVEIVSLNTFGSKVARKDKVKVFVSAEVSHLQDASYDWSCTGGSLINPPGMFENVWQAPAEPGVYEISVTVKCNGEKASRSTKITVTDEYFYRDYGATYSNDGMSTSNVTPTAQADFPSLGYLVLTSTNNNSRYYRNFNDSELLPAFSWQIKYRPFTVASASDKVSFRLNFSRPSGAMKYITQVEIQTFPVSGFWSSNYTFYDVSKGGSTVQTITPTTSTAEAGLIGGKGNNDVLKWRHMSMSIDEQLNLIFYLEGKQLLKTAILKELETAEGFKYNISSAEINLSNKVVGYFDDFTVFDNGTILTGQERNR